MIEIPDNYFSNLSSYEEFVIKTNLLGYDVSDKEVLESLNKVENYYWLVINGHLCFLNDKGNKTEDVVIKGDFDCSDNNLTSLEGCPERVGGSFDCSENQLTSLEGCPNKIGKGFYCSYNQLTSLKGCPEKVNGDFYCSYNQLTSLEGCPKEVGGDFSCSHNQLTSLEGCPKKIGRDFYCSNNSKKLLKPNNLKCKNFYN